MDRYLILKYGRQMSTLQKVGENLGQITKLSDLALAVLPASV